MSDYIDQIIRDVAELPDRDSPDGWPEAMLVTGPELRAIIELRTPAGDVSSIQTLNRITRIQRFGEICGGLTGKDLDTVAELAKQLA